MKHDNVGKYICFPKEATEEKQENLEELLDYIVNLYHLDEDVENRPKPVLPMRTTYGS